VRAVRAAGACWSIRPPSRHRRVIGLRLVGEVYLPFLQANADAAEAGEERFSMDIRGNSYTQDVFRYQIKCLRWLQSDFAGLDAERQASIRLLLEETGCLAILEARP
jgi:hypothetical protein